LTIIGTKHRHRCLPLVMLHVLRKVISWIPPDVQYIIYNQNVSHCVPIPRNQIIVKEKLVFIFLLLIWNTFIYRLKHNQVFLF